MLSLQYKVQQEISNYNFISQLFSFNYIVLLLCCLSIGKNFHMPLIYRSKDGVPIEKNSTCYKMKDFNLIITDLQQKHAGVYTISLGNQVVGLYRNLSFTLVVHGKILP